jgi:hypothetical protein
MSSSIPVKLRKHFANCCAYCRTAEDLTATTFEFEHILPRAAGGETVFENICLSCPMCNRYKSDRVHWQDAALPTPSALFHPHHDRWSDHFTWNEGATELIDLTPVGRATIAALKMNRPQMIRVRRM